MTAAAMMLALTLGQPTPDDIVSRSLDPATREACLAFNARQRSEVVARRRPPDPIPMAELERRAWTAWLLHRHGFNARPCP